MDCSFAAIENTSLDHNMPCLHGFGGGTLGMAILSAMSYTCKLSLIGLDFANYPF
jgi:hypothetical protein